MPHKRNPELCERVTAWRACSAATRSPPWRTSRSGTNATSATRPRSGSSSRMPASCWTTCSHFHGRDGPPDRLPGTHAREPGALVGPGVLPARTAGADRERDEPPGRIRIVQRNAMKAWKERTPFSDLLLADPEVTSRISEGTKRAIRLRLLPHEHRRDLRAPRTVERDWIPGQTNPRDVSASAPGRPHSVLYVRWWRDSSCAGETQG